MSQEQASPSFDIGRIDWDSALQPSLEARQDRALRVGFNEDMFAIAGKIREGKKPEEYYDELRLSKISGMPLSAVMEDKGSADLIAYRKAFEGDMSAMRDLVDPKKTPSLIRLLNEKPVGETAGMVTDRALWAYEAQQRGFFDELSQSYEMGDLQQESLGLLWKDIQGEASDVDRARIDLLEQRQQLEMQRRQGEGLGMEILRGSAGLLPQFRDLGINVAHRGLQGAIMGAATGGTVGAAVGSVVPGAGTAAGGAAGAGTMALTGFKAGSITGSFEHIYKMGAAEIYGGIRNLKDESGNSIDPATARAIALVAALPMAGLDLVSMGKAVELIPGLDRLLNQGAVEALTNYLQANPGIGAALSRAGVGIAKALGIEATTESLQEGVVVAAEEIAKNTGNLNLEGITVSEAMGRMADAGRQALTALLPYAAGGGAMRAYANRRIQQARRAAGNLQELHKLAAESETVRLAPELAGEVQKRISEEGGASDLYIRPEAFQRVFFQSEEGMALAAEMGVTPQALAENLALDTDIAVPADLALTHILNDEKVFNELAPDMRQSPDIMTPREAEAYESSQEGESSQAEQEGFDFLDNVFSGLDEEIAANQRRDAMAAPYVQQLVDAGYSERQAGHMMSLFAANAEQMAPLFNQSPEEFLSQRLAGFQLAEPGMMNLTEADLEDRARRQLARAPLAERDPLLALVRGRLDGADIKNYDSQGQKELAAKHGRGLFKGKAKGGLPLDLLADEAVREGLLAEGSGANELLAALRDRESKRYFQPLNPDVNLNKHVPVISAQAETTPVWQSMKGIDRKAIVDAIAGDILNETTGETINLSRKNAEHLISSTASRGIGGQAHIAAVRNVKELLRVAEKIESYSDGKGQQDVSTIHRFFAPMRYEGGIYTVNMTVKEYGGEGSRVVIEGVKKLYDLKLVKKNTPGFADAGGSKAPGVRPEGASEVTIRQMLDSVNDSEGRRYFQSAPPTESAAFKKWFGKSKVVDENGKPLVVYHGTGTTIEAFDPSFTGQGNDQLGSGFYFTSNVHTAKGYETATLPFSNQEKPRGVDSPNTVSAYLTIKKPIFLAEDQESLRDVEVTKKQVAAIMLKAPNIFDPDESPLANWVDNGGRRFSKRHADEVSDNYTDDLIALENDFFGGSATAFREAVNAVMGYDGVIKVFKNGEKHFVAWFPTQIKSVNNRGTFDPNDPRILYQSAFHGSPHRFDKFSLEHIGSGEGAQAYGWGLYFAGDKAIAEWYREELTRPGRTLSRDLTMDGKRYRVSKDGEWTAPDGSPVPDGSDQLYALELVTHYGADEAAGRIALARESLEDIGEAAYAEEFGDEARSLASFDNIERLIRTMPAQEETGQLYEVDIPEDGEMLDWDKPISQQSEKVRQSLLDISDEKSIADDIREQAQADFEENGPSFYPQDRFDTALEEAISEGDYGETFGANVWEELAEAAPGLDWNAIRKQLYSGIEAHTGESVYKGLSEKLGSDRAASEHLNSLGIKGIRYLDATSRDAGEGSYNYVIFDDSAIEILNTYYQHRAEGARGAISQLEDGRWLVNLFRGKKNLSTVIHEGGHFFLENLREAAQLESAPERVRESWAALQAEYGFEGFDLTRDMHERFAREFEAYAREGRAPSPRLQSAFRQFGNWLVRLYRSVRSLIGADEISPEVRRVFDRLLATEQEIEEAQRRGTSPLSLDAMEAAGLEVAPELRGRHARAVEEARRRAESVIAVRRMVEQRASEKLFRKESEARLRQESFYRAEAEIRERGGIDWQSVLAVIDEDLAQDLRRKWTQPFTKGLFKEDGALDFSDVAADFNVDSPHNLAGLLLGTPTLREAVDADVQTALAEWDKSFDGSMEYSNAMDEALAVELEALTGEKQLSGKAFRAELDRRMGVKKASAVDAEYRALSSSLGKLEAAQRKELRAARAEGHAGGILAEKMHEGAKREKERRGWQEKAAELKAQERAKRAALAAAYRARIERDKLIRQVRTAAKSKSIDDGYRQQILAMVAHWRGLGSETMRPRDPDGMPTLMAFIGQETSLFEEESSLFPEWLFSESQRAGAKSAGDMTLEELRDVARAIQILAHKGRQHSRLIAAGKNTELRMAVGEMAESMNKMAGTSYLSEQERASFRGKVLGLLRGTAAEVTTMRYLFDAMDGYVNKGGPDSQKGAHHKYIVSGFQDAMGRELGMLREYDVKLSLSLAKLHQRDARKAFAIDGVALPEDVSREWGGLWTHEKVVAVALNMGNAGNLKAMMRGYGWGEADLQRITARLTAAEWRAVEEIWDIINELYPALNETHRQIHGVPLGKVEAQPFTIQAADGAVTVRGGYYPLVFDRMLSRKAEEQQSADDLINRNESLLRSAKPKSGMTKDRKGGTLPPKLSLGIIRQHVTDTIHYTTHAPILRDVNRVFNTPEYRNIFIRAAGMEAYNELTPWLRHIARPEGEHATKIDRTVEWLARRGTLFVLALNMKSALLQLSSLGNSMQEVGKVNFVRGVGRMMSRPHSTFQEVRAKSAYMENRGRMLDASLREWIDRISATGATGVEFMGRRYTLEQVQNAQFGLIQGLDAAVAYPTWLAAYDVAVAAGLEEADAVHRADEAVIRAQGSGGPMDVARVLRRRGFIKLFTPFMTFALNDFNRKQYYVGGFREYLRGGNSQIDFKTFAQHFALEWVVPVVFSTMMLSLGRDGELPDTEDYVWEAIGFLTMGLPVVRDVARLAETQFTGKGFGSRMGGSVAFSGFESGVKAVRQGHKWLAEDDDKAQARFFRELINTMGFVYGMGTPQLWRTIDGAEAYFVDDRGGPLAPLLGKPQNK